MNRSLRISHWQLATIGLVCCISGIRILLSVGNRVLLQEGKVPSQTLPQTQELLDRSHQMEDQSDRASESRMYNPSSLPSQLDKNINHNKSLQ